MFIVKGVRGNFEKEFSLFECDELHVSESPASSPDSVQCTVSLYKSNGPSVPASIIAHLEIGNGGGHFHAAYIMNERGKTVDTISAGRGG